MRPIWLPNAACTAGLRRTRKHVSPGCASRCTAAQSLACWARVLGMIGATAACGTERAARVGQHGDCHSVEGNIHQHHPGCLCWMRRGPLDVEVNGKHPELQQADASSRGGSSDSLGSIAKHPVFYCSIDRRAMRCFVMPCGSHIRTTSTMVPNSLQWVGP
jgi:hypothetical protein